MDPISGIFLTLGLFGLAFLNPGANLFVVVQTTLSSGRKAGVICASGVVFGDAIYSGLGLFGLNALMTQFEHLFSFVKIFGGLYLLWYAWTVFHNEKQLDVVHDKGEHKEKSWVFFRRGLISDLSNPQTVLFFVSIFSITLTPETPLWVKLVTWVSIVLLSLVWRLFLCYAFSTHKARMIYSRISQTAGKVISIILSALALKLIYQGVEDFV